MASALLSRVAVPLVVAGVVLAIVLGAAAVTGRFTPGDGPSSVVVPGSGNGAAAEPGSVGSGMPSVSPGSEPGPGGSPGPDEEVSQFTSVTLLAGGRSVMVTFWGGVEACYDYTVTATETAETVALTRTERFRGKGACIDRAVEHSRTVALDAPLGGRSVVDALTGKTLLDPTR